ncbi:MAG: GNAT family N-acetyltransferase [Acidobacteria bacterium]|nr:GNAT family N-acetyltransferase [Acidobacteriota bacterium]
MSTFQSNDGAIAGDAMQFRAYCAKDADPMYALDVACFERPFRFSRGTMRRFAEAKNARVIVAEERGALVGFVIVDVEASGEGRVGYVVTLDVDPGCRRRGIARGLMMEAETRARREGCDADAML